MEVKLTTLCYIEKDGCYLMLHRNSRKKKNDLSADMWIGVGGHFEGQESPSECLLREVKEETGLTLTSYRLRGIVTFLYSEANEATEKITEFEYMFLYTADGYTGSLKECDEGELKFIPKEALDDLYFWTGDEIFLKLIRDEAPLFDLKLTYHGKTLQNAVLDGTPLELFDVLDESFEPSGVVRERSIVHERGDWHRTVHVWVVRRTENSFEVLLQKRAAHKDSFPGCYDISSAGHMQAGEDYGYSAVRELFEELGISAEENELTLLGTHITKCDSQFYGKPFINREHSRVYLYDATGRTLQLTLQPQEVEETRWMEYASAGERMRTGELQNCIQTAEWELLGKWYENGKTGNEGTVN